MEKLRYGAYMRKSTEEAERQVLSLSSQEDKVKERFSDLNIVLHAKKVKAPLSQINAQSLKNYLT